MRIIPLPALAALVFLVGCDASAPSAESIDFDSLPALAAGTTVVTPSDLAESVQQVVREPSRWFFYDDETDRLAPGLGAFVSGPVAPPAGSGSVELSASGSQRRALATYRFGRTRLDQITALGFSTYNPAAGNGGKSHWSGYLGVTVSFDGSHAFQGRINSVPKRNGPVDQDSWQAWDALNGGDGVWVWSGYAAQGDTWPDGVTTKERTWSDIVSSFPAAVVHPRYPWVGVRVGSPFPEGYTENIDAIVVGVGGVTHTYDFEP